MLRSKTFAFCAADGHPRRPQLAVQLRCLATGVKAAGEPKVRHLENKS
ncbi:hypothetical protein [Microcoleus sp.]